MLRVLFGTEFGSGSGHFLPARFFTDEIRARKPDTEFAYFVPTVVDSVRKLLESSQVHSPDFLRGNFEIHPTKPGLTHGELAARQLLGDETAFAARLAGWRDAIAAFKPNVVISDYAPCLSMAARNRVPVLAVASGYTLPPPEAAHFTPIWGAPEFDPRSEQKIVEGFNRLLKQAGLRKLSFLPQMNQANAYALLTLPIFDPYWEIRQQDYLGIFHPGGSPEPAPDTGRGLAYFSNSTPSSYYPVIAAGLLESGLPFCAHISGRSAEDLSLPSGGAVAFVTALHDLKSDLPGGTIAVHAGSLGMAGAALYAGVPQVMLCTHEENFVNARGATIAQIGKGINVGKSSPTEIAKLIREVAGDKQIRDYALALAKHYSPFRNSNPAARVAELALSIAHA